MCSALTRGTLTMARLEAMVPRGLITGLLDALRSPAALIDAHALLLALTLMESSRVAHEWLVARELPTLCALARSAEPAGPSAPQDGGDGSTTPASAAVACLAKLAADHAPALAAAGCAEALLHVLGAADARISGIAATLLEAFQLPGSAVPRLLALVESAHGRPAGACAVLAAAFKSPGRSGSVLDAGAVRSLALQIARGDPDAAHVAANTLFGFWYKGAGVDPTRVGREALEWGVLPGLVDLLRGDDQSACSAARLLAGLLDSGLVGMPRNYGQEAEFAVAAAAAGAAPPLLALLRTGSEEAAAWALAAVQRLAAVPALRDGLLAHGAAAPLLQRLLGAMRTVTGCPASNVDVQHAILSLRGLADGGRGGAPPPRLAAAVRAFVDGLPDADAPRFSDVTVDGTSGDRAAALLSGLRQDGRFMLAGTPRCLLAIGKAHIERAMDGAPPGAAVQGLFGI
jgi:hypothetical protein